MDPNMMSSGTATMAMTGTMTMDMASATSSAAMSMEGMGSNCKISMLWNWNTVDSCFISSSWHVTSKGMFAGSCIGVIFLVLSLEFLRRSVKEWDRYLVKQHLENFEGSSAAAAGDSDRNKSGASACTVVPPFRPNVWQQAIRALLHMMQFAVAYFVMLLAMYYNGYLIICIFIGAFLGAFIFQWETLTTRYIEHRASFSPPSFTKCAMGMAWVESSLTLL
ncbi:Fc.00g019850.m01.CDS01 [Cosmosporella sp. VM-42]